MTSFVFVMYPQSKEWHKRTPAVGLNVGINPHNPNTLYCEKFYGQLHISRNHGQTWSALPTSPPISGIRHILVHPKDTLTIFAVAFSGGLWKTTNEGTSWYQVLPNYGIDGESMDFDPARSDTMYAGNFGDGAVFRSSDRGETWTYQGSAGSNLCALTIRPDSVNILLAGAGASTIAKSTDFGVTWTIVNYGGTAEVPKIVVNPNTPTIAYATTYGSDANANLWKTTDGGGTWFKTALQQVNIWSLEIDVQHPETLYIGRFTSSLGPGIERTTDGGATFSTISKGLPSDYSAWNLRVHPLNHNDVWVAGTHSAFGYAGVYQLFDSIPTRLQGTIRDSVTDAPLSATISVAETGENFVASTFDFTYITGDPSLTLSLHVTRTNYVPKDTTLTFVPGTTVFGDIHIGQTPYGSISGKVFSDLNNDGVKDVGEPGVANQQILLTGPIFKFMQTDINGDFTYDSLNPGTYTVRDFPPAGWNRTVPLSGMYSGIVISGGDAVVDQDFGRFHPNSLTVRKFEDLDGNFATEDDRVLKSWHLQIDNTTATSPVAIASDESGSITSSNLTDGTYTVSEADSGWVTLGYLLDDAPFPGTSNSVEVELTDGDTVVVDFINASPEYAQSYRTATVEDWALGVDAKGKHKAIKRKNDKVYFKFTLSIATPVLPIIEFKFNMAVDSLTMYSSTAKTDTVPYDLLTVDPKKKVWRYTFGTNPSPPAGTVLQLDGKGLMGKLVSVNYLRTDGTLKIKGKVPDGSTSFIKNEPGLPLPNLHNIGEELFPKGFGQISPYYATGMLIGIPQGVKNANSVLLTKYTNVYKSLYVEKLDLLHSFGPLCLDFFDDGKPISKQQTMLPATKQDNALFAQLVALKLNVAASATQKFPAGLGELTFNDKTNPINPFNGQMVSDIILKADTLISCLPLLSKTPSPTLDELYDVLDLINSAFTDTANFKDTLSFSAKTRLPGVDVLSAVPYLRKTPGVQPVIARDLQEDYRSSSPLTFQLHQNYPNPFNPSTTIQFGLDEPALVTLNIYNMLGQEVAILLDNEEMEEGPQEIDFSAGDLPSGVYFYRLVANIQGNEDEGTIGRELMSVKKMVLIK